MAISRDFANIPLQSSPDFSIKATVEESRIDPAEIGEIIMGQVLSAGVGQAPARQALHAAGLPDSIGAVTINKVCGSGLFAAMLATRSIQAGVYRAAIAGGMESMTKLHTSCDRDGVDGIMEANLCSTFI